MYLFEPMVSEPLDPETPPEADEQLAPDKKSSRRFAWQRGPLGVVVLVAVVGLAGWSANRLIGELTPKKRPDLGVRLRSGAGSIPLYPDFTAPDRIHWLDGGALVDIDDAKVLDAGMSRCPVVFRTPDGLDVRAYVETKDLVPEEVNAFRERIKKWRGS